MKVWVTTYSHRHGTDIHVFSSEAGVERHKQDIAQEWWDSEIGEDRPKPDDPKAMADQYFEIMAERDEFFDAEQCEVHP